MFQKVCVQIYIVSFDSIKPQSVRLRNPRKGYAYAVRDVYTLRDVLNWFLLGGSS